MAAIGPSGPVIVPVTVPLNAAPVIAASALTMPVP